MTATKAIEPGSRASLALQSIQDAQSGEWHCPCGNAAHLDGFQTCNVDGEEMEPGQDWPELFFCNACGLLIDNAGAIVGDTWTREIFPAAILHVASLIRQTLPEVRAFNEALSLTSTSMEAARTSLQAALHNAGGMEGHVILGLLERLQTLQDDLSRLRKGRQT